jgi:hypothetical protein
MRIRLKSGNFLFYKQTGYETGQVFSLVTADDGLNGISYARNKPSFIDHVTFEFLYTGNQGSYISWIGKVFNVVDTHYGETVPPFYNLARSSGWTYSGNERLIIGTAYFNTGVTTTWYYSGVMWFDRVISGAEVTTLYNGGAGVGLNAVDTDGHWWGLSANTNDRIASYSQATAYANYNFIYESGSMYFNQDVRPSY